jgi:hypothetical protein
LEGNDGIGTTTGVCVVGSSLEQLVNNKLAIKRLTINFFMI